MLREAIGLDAQVSEFVETPESPENRSGEPQRSPARQHRSTHPPALGERGQDGLEVPSESSETRGSKPDKAQKKPKRKKSRQAEVGTSRGIESMFRTSYRTQLSMIALAATKANIMISINGFLLSMLTVSSVYVLATEPRLLIPGAVLVTTCVVSIVFAVLAARPQKTESRRTRLDTSRSHRAELLNFEYFSGLAKQDYVNEMLELMRDQEGVYTAMISQLHFLGCSADRRFKLLRFAYGSFLLGIVLSFLALVSVAIASYAQSPV